MSEEELRGEELYEDVFDGSGEIEDRDLSAEQYQDLLRVSFSRAFNRIESAVDRPDRTLSTSQKRIERMIEGEGLLGECRFSDLQPDLFDSQIEQSLYDEIISVRSCFEDSIPSDQRDWREFISTQLVGLAEEVDDLFDQVHINVDDDEVKRNRHLLLNEVRNLYLRAADFTELDV